MANLGVPSRGKSQGGSTSGDSIGNRLVQGATDLIGFAKDSALSFLNKQTGAGLTGAQLDERNYQTEMANTAYQRQVSDMKAAGLNPALLYGSGAGSGADTPGQDVGSNGASLGELLQAALLKSEIDLNKATAKEREANAGLTDKKTAWFDELTEAQIGEIQQAIATGKADEALKRAGVDREQASAILAANQAILASIDSATRDRLNQLQAELMSAQAGAAAASARNSNRQADKVSAEINELYQRAILQAAQAGSFDAQTRNLLIQEGILVEQHKQAQTETARMQFEVDHQKADRNWRIAGQITSSVLGAVSAGAQVATGTAALRKASPVAGFTFPYNTTF